MSHVCAVVNLRTGCCVQTDEFHRQKTHGPGIAFVPIRLEGYLGRMIFSLGRSEAKSLKVLNLTGGGWRKGLAPKLNSHCWYDIKLAAAKKPDLSGCRLGGGRKEARKENRGENSSGTKIGYTLRVYGRSSYVAEEKTCFSGGSWCPFR